MAERILLSTCARANSAAEARFRIDAPIAPSRGARVIALDEGAEPTLLRISDLDWATARFYVAQDSSEHAAADGWLADIRLRRLTGDDALLSQELFDASVVVMVATSDDGAPTAAAIGEACTLRGVMTAGLILGRRVELRDAVAALRPHARVLMVTDDEHDVAEVLTALRA